MNAFKNIKIILKPIGRAPYRKMYLYFPDIEEIHKAIRNLPSVEWDNRMKYWMLPMDKTSLQQLFKTFKNIAWIDQSEVVQHINNTIENGGERFGITASLNEEKSKISFENKRQYKLSEQIFTRENRNKKSNTSLLPTLPIDLENRITKFRDWMMTRRYSMNTIENYLSTIRLYFRYNLPKLPENLTVEDQERFNKNYILANNLSYSYQNTFVNGLKCFMQYEKIPLEDRVQLERPRSSSKLPFVLSVEEVKLILNSVYNVKHKAMLAIIYECGLRCGEVLSLTPKSIQTERNMLFIQAAKGKKDRYVPISDKLITFLRKYFIQYRPLNYLFEGEKAGHRYSERSLQLVIKRSVAKAGIRKNVTVHTLRHCFATHHLEGGTDIRYIQHLLGHNSPKTTQIYTHVSNAALKRIPSLLDGYDL